MAQRKNAVPACADPTVQALAKQIRGKKGAWDFGRRGVLADALEEAGVNDAYLLGLLRHPHAEPFLVQLEVGKLVGGRPAEAARWFEASAEACGLGPTTFWLVGRAYNASVGLLGAVDEGYAGLFYGVARQYAALVGTLAPTVIRDLWGPIDAEVDPGEDDDPLEGWSGYDGDFGHCAC
jgi:hypothetical protein